jgi:hypothetical protein
MKKIVLAFLLFATSVRAQNATTDFVLDQSKPYVYLQFDHLGPRKPIQEGEPAQGLWLRLVNNCRIPVKVRTYGFTTGDPGTGVFDEVIPYPPMLEIRSDLDQPPASEDQPKQKMPRGYDAELSSMSTVLPGKSLLFSVPRNHVSRDWFMRVKFALDVSKPSVGIGPLTELDFFENQIPPNSVSRQ